MSHLPDPVTCVQFEQELVFLFQDLLRLIHIPKIRYEIKFWNKSFDIGKKILFKKGRYLKNNFNDKN